MGVALQSRVAISPVVLMLSPQLFLGRSQNLPPQDLAVLGGSEHSGLDILGVNTAKCVFCV